MTHVKTDISKPLKNTAMTTNKTTDPNQHQPAGVQLDNETPLPKKPSVLFIAATSIGIVTIILLSVSAYYSAARF